MAQHFVHVSRHLRGQVFTRSILQATNGLHPEVWKEDQTNLEDGIYCQECIMPIIAGYVTKPENEKIKDRRIDLWSASAFPLDQVTDLFMKTAEKTGASVAIYKQPKRTAVFGQLDRPLPDILAEKLMEKGINKLYIHQTEAINRIREGKNTVIVTGTASGKSLVYTIPILESLLEDSNETALYLSPLKALTRDQLETLSRWSDRPAKDQFGFQSVYVGENVINAGVLEGGSGDAVRSLTYEQARYWMTNVHYLHYMLRGPFHFPKNSNRMRRYFQNLRYVVLDELHSYNGVLGSKVAMLIRRLRLLCRELGNDRLQFISCSASIGNPKELAEEITGMKHEKGFELINQDGSPTHEKHILLWNPGKLHSQSADRTRRAPVSDMIELYRNMIEGYGTLPKSIVFMKNRRAAASESFNLNRAVRPALQESVRNTDLPEELFSPFHAQVAGPLKERLMNQLKSNELAGLVATSALEMGIDIGDLSVCLMIGYAGSKASFLQQAGRVGRSGPGLVVQLFQEDPLEQYYATHPDEFMERKPEYVTIDSQNAKMTAEHSIYAANECGGKLKSPHAFFKISKARQETSFQKYMTEMKRGVWSITTPVESYEPLIAGGKIYQVVHKSGMNADVLYEGVDERSRLRDYHTDAVFLHNQRLYRVHRILYKKGVIEARPVAADYITRSHIQDTVSVTNEKGTTEQSGVIVSYGDLDITVRLWGYKKVKILGGAVIEDVQETTEYPVKYSTEGLWIQFVPQIINVMNERGLHVIEHAMAAAIPSLIKCAQGDFAMTSSVSLKDFSFRPTIILYETAGGGAGIAGLVQERLAELFQKALAILSACSCKDGCPNCTHLSSCDRGNEGLDKRNGMEVLERLIEEIQK
ncbi:DEAD/DEAH box helicase [Domibacillus sp. A3M-37]|uniref:DEAD/DEAH box helicase n=1 Tax=Domibacillus sp. A3M-37 TaxID=2962037 RepID=UPI0020B805D5|nr:DEAD/DEAH box helicase [Domibacillus sp. A3M-37]MCP3764576.1 DEAD/DEAH box helicase [Domibacillus sp. A3M-37]